MLEVITPATNFRMVSADDVMLDLDKTYDEDWLNNLINEQSVRIANACGRVFAKQTYRQTFRPSQAEEDLILLRWPLVSVTSIVEDGTTLTPDDWEADYTVSFLYRLSSDTRTEWRAKKIVVTYVAGYDTFPFDLQRATKELVKGAIYNRTRDPGLKSLVLPGVSEEQWFYSDTADLPPEIQGMVLNYRQIKF